jgi:hypothetical protein
MNIWRRRPAVLLSLIFLMDPAMLVYSRLLDTSINHGHGFEFQWGLLSIGSLSNKDIILELAIDAFLLWRICAGSKFCWVLELLSLAGATAFVAFAMAETGSVYAVGFLLFDALSLTLLWAPAILHTIARRPSALTASQF